MTDCCGRPNDECGAILEIARLRGERDEARVAVERVRALHVPYDGKDPVTLTPRRYCKGPEHHLFTPYPCATIRALDAEATP